MLCRPNRWEVGRTSLDELSWKTSNELRKKNKTKTKTKPTTTKRVDRSSRKRIPGKRNKCKKL